MARDFLYSQDTKAQNEYNGDLGLLGHLDAPQHGNGEQSLGCVSQHGKHFFFQERRAPRT